MPRMSSDLRVTHKRASGLPGLRQQIMMGSFVGPCARESCSRGSSLSPVRVSMGKRSAQVWLRPPLGPAGYWIPDVLGASPGPLPVHPTETKILRNLTSWVPQQRKRRGALLLFGRETQRRPRLDSRVWVDGCHQYFSSTSCQDPAPGFPSTPPCKAQGLPARECWQILPGWGLGAGNDVSNAVKVKLKHGISRGQPVCGSWLSGWLGVCRLCEGRDKACRVPDCRGPLINSC